MMTKTRARSNVPTKSSGTSRKRGRPPNQSRLPSRYVEVYGTESDEVLALLDADRRTFAQWVLNVVSDHITSISPRVVRGEAIVDGERRAESRIPLVIKPAPELLVKLRHVAALIAAGVSERDLREDIAVRRVAGLRLDGASTYDIEVREPQSAARIRKRGDAGGKLANAIGQEKLNRDRSQAVTHQLKALKQVVEERKKQREPKELRASSSKRRT